MFRYETHLHTAPVSKCATADVESSLWFYKSLGYKGVFITDHFLNGNINISRDEPMEKRLDFYFSSYEEAKKLSSAVGIDVFSGIELSYKGTDFLVYGLDKSWFMARPDWEMLKMSELLKLIMDSDALVIQAHPFRTASYIDHIRLFPQQIHGVETVNANRDALTNEMAAIFAEKYSLLEVAGSDNHQGPLQKRLAGMEFETPLKDERDFIQRIKNKEGNIFHFKIGE